MLMPKLQTTVLNNSPLNLIRLKVFQKKIFLALLIESEYKYKLFGNCKLINVTYNNATNIWGIVNYKLTQYLKKDTKNISGF